MTHNNKKTVSSTPVLRIFYIMNQAIKEAGINIFHNFCGSRELLVQENHSKHILKGCSSDNIIYKDFLVILDHIPAQPLQNFSTTLCQRGLLQLFQLHFLLKILWRGKYNFKRLLLNIVVQELKLKCSNYKWVNCKHTWAVMNFVTVFPKNLLPVYF